MVRQTAQDHVTSIKAPDARSCLARGPAALSPFREQSTEAEVAGTNPLAASPGCQPWNDRREQLPDVGTHRLWVWPCGVLCGNS